MSEQFLSTQPYNSADEAAMGGFNKIMITTDYKTSEYAFWVVLKAVEGKMTYHYTNPQTDRTPHGINLKMPPSQHGHHVRAFCHTHPGSIKTGDFSSGDLDEFKRLMGQNLSLVYYLLNPYGEIRVARAPEDFMAGKTVFWKAVKP